MLADDTGSATVEWTVAVAIVVMLAVPVMSLIGAGSENQSREIAVSIQEAEQAADHSGHSGGTGLADTGPEDAGTAPPPDREPGSDLGIGYSGRQTTAHTSHPGRGADPLLYSASFGVLRRDKPVDRPPQPAGAGRAEAATLPLAGSGVNLPRMPRQHVVFNLAECVEPIDPLSITEARYTASDVVMSGR